MGRARIGLESARIPLVLSPIAGRLPAVKRDHRRLFFGLTSLSLLLCIASAAIFIRSEFVSEGYLKLHFDITARQYTFAAVGWSNGTVICARAVTQFPTGWDSLLALGRFPLSDSAGYRRFSAAADGQKWLWIGVHRNDFGFSIHSLLIFFPSLILPIIAIRRLVVARRARRVGRCLGCGYDLRTTPDRCPECGMVAVKG